MPVSAGEVAVVRGFNRFYTGVIGVLGEGLVRSPYSLTEARVVFELAQRESTEVVALRRDLGLDPGHLSRMLARFESDGLVVRERSAADARRQVAALTPAGRDLYAMLDRRSAEDVEALLEKLSDDERRRLLTAMRTVETLLGDGTPSPAGRADSCVLRPLRPGDLGWVVQRNGALYAEEYGWDQTYEALVARIVADYVDGRDPSRENAWIAEVDGEPAGCIFCVRKDDRVAQLRLLLVEPSARGLGIGTRLVNECLDFAADAGYAEMTLWTNDCLTAARRIYERTGFTLVAEEPHHSFGHTLTGQSWQRPL